MHLGTRHGCFNPRPALASGTTSPGGLHRHPRAVSIRAPLSRAGRLNPTLGFTHHIEVSIRAPLSRAGRLAGPVGCFSETVVSIRAPLSRAGRLVPEALFPHDLKFQSAPRSRERDDQGAETPQMNFSGFNPRPALASGTTKRIQVNDILMLFQSAPRSRERDDRLLPWARAQ